MANINAEPPVIIDVVTGDGCPGGFNGRNYRGNLTDIPTIDISGSNVISDSTRTILENNDGRVYVIVPRVNSIYHLPRSFTFDIVRQAYTPEAAGNRVLPEITIGDLRYVFPQINPIEADAFWSGGGFSPIINVFNNTTHTWSNLILPRFLIS